MHSGGLNFDCKVRRESSDVEDMFISHIAAMDTFARGLRIAAKIIEEGRLSEMVKDRYSSYDEGIGKQIENGEISFEELEKWVLQHGEPQQKSGKQEKFEAIFNQYV